MMLLGGLFLIGSAAVWRAAGGLGWAIIFAVLGVLIAFGWAVDKVLGNA